MTSDPQQLLDAIGAHIRAHLDDNPTPASIAAHFGMNRFHLSRWFRQHAHIPLRDYIAALKIEQGIAPLVDQQSIITAQQESGHQSAATFTHRFRHATGITPRDYRKQMPAYQQLLESELEQHGGRTIPYRRVPVHDGHPLHVRVSGSDARLVFAGLFPEPVPRGVPLAGAALFDRKTFTIPAPPPGTYWLLGCELLPSRNPLDYFRLDHCQRERYPDPITFPLPAPQSVELILRPFQPGDPPITVNLPRLLFEVLRGGHGHK
ncbi:MAG: AraC family transcriptional regulator [Cardiobacteriaceae bacterium]|nr:AraC family transcriptional regulator [Cardiobacteriaceae bacterium]